MRNIAILPFMLIFLIVGCDKNTSDIDKELYKLSYGRYEIAEGGMFDKYYTDYKGNTISMPLLPCGLFLYFFPFFIKLYTLILFFLSKSEILSFSV